MNAVTITRDSEERAGGEAGGRVRSRLIFVGDAGDPRSVSSSHSLDDLHEVRFRRGPRSVERSRGVLVLAFPDSRMSGEHGRWLRRGTQWLVEDPSSKNGTLVDGEMARSTLLHEGAVIELGHSFFLFRQSPVEAVPAHLVGDLDANQLPAWPPGLATFYPPLAREYERLVRLAASPVSLLLMGETGSGKEVVARAIHLLSERREEFVAVNCGALPGTLVESELFGHGRGAFSGAIGTRLGLVRSADKGTLFLDEIGELAPAAQAALLRVLQEREVLPVGEDRPVAVDLRVITATLRDLDAAVAEGRFRPDLYARIASHVVTLPPLRDRREDLGLLVAAMLAKHRPIRLAPAALRALLSHDWPRNIRELEQALSTAIALTSGDVVELEHLPASIGNGGAAKSAADAAPALDDEERELRAKLSELLSKHEGNVVAVARALGKERAQIYRWVRRFAIDLEAFRRT